MKPAPPVTSTFILNPAYIDLYIIAPGAAGETSEDGAASLLGHSYSCTQRPELNSGRKRKFSQAGGGCRFCARLQIQAERKRDGITRWIACRAAVDDIAFGVIAGDDVPQQLPDAR